MILVVIKNTDLETLLKQNTTENTQNRDTMNVKQFGTTTLHHHNDLYPPVSFFHDENMYLVQHFVHVLPLSFHNIYP